MTQCPISINNGGLALFDPQTGETETLVDQQISLWYGSPDGNYIAMIVPQENQLLVFDRRDASTRILTDDIDQNSPFTWSPDSQQIIYISEDLDVLTGENRLKMVTLSDGSITVLGERVGGYDDPHWSPDGQWLAYTIFEETNFQVILRDIETGEEQALFPAKDLPRFASAWSPQSTHLLVLANEASTGLPAKRDSRAQSNRGDRLLIVDVETQNGEQIASNAQHPAWSPDGATVAYLTQNDDTHAIMLYDVAAQTTDVLHEVTGGGISPLVWSPDGTQLAFVSYPDYWQNGTLKIMTLATGDIQDTESTAFFWPQWIACGDAE